MVPQEGERDKSPKQIGSMGGWRDLGEKGRREEGGSSEHDGTGRLSQGKNRGEQEKRYQNR